MYQEIAQLSDREVLEYPTSSSKWRATFKIKCFDIDRVFSGDKHTIMQQRGRTPKNAKSAGKCKWLRKSGWGGRTENIANRVG